MGQLFKIQDCESHIADLSIVFHGQYRRPKSADANWTLGLEHWAIRTGKTKTDDRKQDEKEKKQKKNTGDQREPSPVLPFQAALSEN